MNKLFGYFVLSTLFIVIFISLTIQYSPKYDFNLSDFVGMKISNQHYVFGH